jgi:hypothetical protein
MHLVMGSTFRGQGQEAAEFGNAQGEESKKI